MLIAICSAKGSPGVTSLALAVAAAWPAERIAVLLEADPTGGDLAFRCRHGGGREVAATPNLLGLAAAVRGGQVTGSADPGVLGEYAQPLACGVRLVPGVPAAAQARGLGSLWGQVAQAATRWAGDVIADLGRLDRTDHACQLAAVAEVLIVVCHSSLESVMHARNLIADLAPALPAHHTGRVFLPVVIGPYRQAEANAADIDQILGGIGIPVARTIGVGVDPRALADLEAGGNPHGRLARSHLLRGVNDLIATVLDLQPSPAGTPTTAASSWEARR